jgi:hypothetical protein
MHYASALFTLYELSPSSKNSSYALARSVVEDLNDIDWDSIMAVSRKNNSKLSPFIIHMTSQAVSVLLSREQNIEIIENDAFITTFKIAFKEFHRRWKVSGTIYLRMTFVE